MTASDPSEFHRPFRLDAVERQKGGIELRAEPAERVALAKRFELIALDALEASVTLRQSTWTPPADASGSGSGRSVPVVAAEAEITASGAQQCVVTLDPVPFALRETVSLLFSAHPVDEPDGLEIDLSDESNEPPEYAPDGIVDLGEVVAQQMALALDPYPRAVDAGLDSDTAAGPPAGPFAALARLNKRVGEAEN